MRYLIVDGHSIIFAWSDLSALHERRTGLARDELARRLTRYQDTTSDRVVLVFDGRNSPRHQSSGGTDTIQIIYSKAGSTADSVIERLTANYSSKYEIVVATDDHMERQTVLSFGASWVGSRELADMLNRAEALLQTRLSSAKLKLRKPRGTRDR